MYVRWGYFSKKLFVNDDIYYYLCRQLEKLEIMAEITLMKPYRQGETLRLYSLTDIVELIRSSEYKSVVDELRNYYPVYQLERQADGVVTGAGRLTSKLPRICFSSEMENRNRQRINKGYTGLVLLEVNNLTGYDEADAVRTGAGEVPQTLMAFVGASGRSVKIVCRGELFPDARSARDDMGQRGVGLPTDADAIALFHENLYERARLAYNAQLGVTIEKLEPRLDRTCYVSTDAETVYNPLAIPFYARAEKPTKALSLVRPTTLEKDDAGSVQSRYFTMHHIYEYNLERAYDECEGITDREEHRHLLLTRLAMHCLETGIPMAVAKRMARYQAYAVGDDDLLIDKVFANVYRPQLVKR